MKTFLLSSTFPVPRAYFSLQFLVIVAVGVSDFKPLFSDESVSEEDYHVCCLLMVFIAISLPKLAKSDANFFKASIGGSHQLH